MNTTAILTSDTLPLIDWRAGPDGMARITLPLCMEEIPAGAMIVPCLSVTGIGPYAYRMSIVIDDYRQTLTPIGDPSLWERFAPAETIADDNIKVATACENIEVEIEWVGTGDFAKASILFSICVLDSVTLNPASENVMLDIPPLSQMEQPEAIRSRICSPTGIAMALRHFGIEADPVTVAAQAYHPGLDLYGVWPSAIYAASLYGVQGYVAALDGLDDVAAALRSGSPVIVSIAYAEGALQGAAIAKTGGHLVTICGIDGDRVIVNDPAAPSAAQVRRSYDMGEFLRAWESKRGVAYVLLHD